MITIKTVSDKYYTLDGIRFAKIYQPLKQGLENIGIYSIYDTRQQLVNSTRYDEFEVDGVVSGSQADTIVAILAVIWSGVSSYEIDQLEDRVTNLEENQVTGVQVYSTLAGLPVTGTLLVSYKVSNDPSVSNNGFYHWSGSAYIKDDIILVTSEVIATEAVGYEKTDFAEAGNQLFNKATYVQDYYIYYLNGNQVSSAGWWHSGYIPVLPSTSYSGTSIRNYAFYDQNKAYISGASPITSLVVTPLNAVYIRFSRNGANTLTTMFNIGSVLLPVADFYNKYRYFRNVQTEEIEDGAVTNDKIGFDEIEIERAEFAVRGSQLFNKATYVQDNYIDSGSGVLVPSVDWWCSDFIQVNSLGTYSGTELRNYAFYDKNKVYISGGSSTVFSVVIPTDAYYFRFSQFNRDETIAMFNVGSVLLPHEEYTYRFKYDIDTPVNPVVLQLPQYIDTVFGEVLQIYYSSMVAFPNWERFYFASSLANAKDLKRYIEFEPNAPGDFTLEVQMFDENNTLRSKASTRIRVRAAVQQPASTVNYWNVGDSLSNDTFYTDEMLRRLTGSGGTPAGESFGNIINNVEGNSGKEWNWYVNNEDSPFVYLGVLDFEQYRIDNGLAVPQVLYILLTWNGMGLNRSQADWDLWDDDVYTFIDALRVDFPAVEVKLLSPQFPSQNGGLGFVVGADIDGYPNILLQNRNALKQAEIYERISKEASYLAWIEHVQTALQVDSLNNMPFVMKDVNTRNSATQEAIGTNNVHPAQSGYFQIADAAYRNFILNYCQ